tara:strand:- start:226 stop:711 length:486 start_codon:yes stop_codon:yes gene_type:complete
MQIINLLLVILILFILFNNHFNNEMESIKNNKNSKNNKIEETFRNKEEMNLTVEKESNSIGQEIKKSVIDTFIISQERIKKSVGNFDMIGKKKMIRAAFSVQPPDEFQMMEMDNNELEKKLKKAAQKNNIRIQIDGKVTKTKMVSKIKNEVLYVNLLLHIS